MALEQLGLGFHFVFDSAFSFSQLHFNLRKALVICISTVSFLKRESCGKVISWQDIYVAVSPPFFTLPMVPWASSPVTRVSRSPLYEIMRKTKRLRRRLNLCNICQREHNSKMTNVFLVSLWAAKFRPVTTAIDSLTCLWKISY